MAEIRLICPDCGTEYQIPETAVPEGGREVECSECGRIWHAERPVNTRPPMEMGVYSYNFAEFKGLSNPPGEAASDEKAQSAAETTRAGATGQREPPKQAPETVPLNRRLPENVLNILLEEVEHERQAREADEATDIHAEQHAVTAHAGDLLDGPDWPATTVTGKRWQPTPAEHAPESTPAAPKPAPVARPEPIVPATTAEAVPPPRNTLPVLATPPAKSDYWQGMGVAAAIAAILLVIYVIAPSDNSDGLLASVRQGLDHARLWLQNAAQGPNG